jgi:hypothetical protein
MRVSRLPEEDGVTAVMMALLLVVFIGMLSLTIDGGLLFAKYRQIRRANDAAALAAALECVKSGDATAAQQSSDTIAAGNTPDAKPYLSNRYSMTPGDPNPTGSTCQKSGGTVKVQYASSGSTGGGVHLVFWPAVCALLPSCSVASPKDVGATAIASWGGGGDATRVAPMMLNMDRLGTCKITNPPDPSLQVGVSQCVFYWNNSPTFDGNAQWGLMNLDPYNNKGTQWYVPGNYNCPSAGGNDIKGWLQNGYPGDLYLNPDGPTYVCRAAGYQTGPVDQGLTDAQGKTYAFPVNDSSKQVDKNGNLCAPPCSPDKYDIIGFAWLRFEYLLTSKKQDDALWAQYCSADPTWVRDSNARCLVTTWMGFSTSVSRTSGGANFGVVATWLSR